MGGDVVRVARDRRASRRRRMRAPGSPSRAVVYVGERAYAYGGRGARARRSLRSSNSTTRSVNSISASTTSRSAPRAASVADRQPERCARGRMRPRRRDRGRDRRARRLLLRGHEQARDGARARKRGTGIAENMMSGGVEVDGQRRASPQARRHTAACSSSTATRRRVRDLDEGRRHRRRRLRRAHERVHGADAAASSSAATPAKRWATRSTRRALYVPASVAGLGADCVEKEMRDEHVARSRELLAGRDRRTIAGFRRYGSARQLYNFKVDNAGRTDRCRRLS